MCHLLQCKLLWDPHCWLSSISKTKRERAGARRQGVRATGRQRSDGDLTDIWKLFQVFVFSDWNFLWKLYWEVILWTQASCFSFMKMWFPFFPPLFICCPQYLELLGPPFTVGLCGGRGRHPVQCPEGAAVLSNYHIAATLGWSREKSSHFNSDYCAWWTSVTSLSLQVPHLKSVSRNVGIRIWTFDLGNPCLWSWLDHLLAVFLEQVTSLSFHFLYLWIRIMHVKQLPEGLIQLLLI